MKTIKSAQTNIGGYRVEFDYDGETTQCFIFSRKASASLQCLLGTGCLDWNEEYERVPQVVIDRIEAWAEAQGY